MKTCAFIAAFVAVSVMPSIAEDGFTPLFDGKTLTGWRNPFEWGKVEVKNGEIHLTGEQQFFIVTEKTYSDFVFEADILLPDGQANSGLMFRAQVQPNKVIGYQAEVDGDTSRKWSGGLYDENRRLWFISPIKGNKESEAAFRARAGDCLKRNDWNTYRITCQGKKLKIEVNGVVTTDVEDDADVSGVIGIQHHGEKGATYKFRNLRIKELSETAAKADGQIIPGEPTSDELTRARVLLSQWENEAPEKERRAMRICYWSPADREPQPEYRARLTRVMEHIHAFYIVVN